MPPVVSMVSPGFVVCGPDRCWVQYHQIDHETPAQGILLDSGGYCGLKPTPLPDSGPYPPVELELDDTPTVVYTAMYVVQRWGRLQRWGGDTR